MNRRRFLQALGVSAASLPFFSLLESSAVEAATPRPMRLLCLLAGYGGSWAHLRPPGISRTTPELALTKELLTFDQSVLEPLKAYAAKMLLIEGIAQKGALQNGTLYSDHFAYASTAFTGSLAQRGSPWLPRSASIEQVLGERLGAGTPVRSLQVGIGSNPGLSDQVTLSYNASGQQLPAIRDPAQLYRQLFGNSGGTVVSSPTPNTALVAKQRRDLSIANALNKSAKRLNARLARAEQRKLDDHLAALADIEARLQGGASNEPNLYPPITCDSPTPPAAAFLQDVPTITNLQFDIITQAFACDRTRFIVADWGINADPRPDVLPDITDLHNDVAHAIDSSDPAVSAKAHADMAKLQRWQAQQLAKLLDRFAQTPDGDGTLLDNTLVVWTSDFGVTTHSGLNVPHVLLGGAQNKFRMGRYLNVAPQAPASWYNDAIPFMPANNSLLVSICRAFGLDVSTFGEPEWSGPLAGLV